jgi:hypothetical protein
MKASQTKVFAALAMALFTPVNAQDQLLAIEFNEDDQEGFELWPSDLAPLTESIGVFPTDAASTSGMTTVTISTNTTFNIPANRAGSTDGDPVGYSFEHLYEDLLHAGSPTGALTLNFSGLNANETYRFTLYAWDPGAGDTSDKEWTVTSGSADPSVLKVNFQDALVNNETFALIYDITATETGTFQVTNTDGLPQSAVNGFKLESLGINAPLEITAISYSPVDRMLTLTWNSREGALYAVKFSNDLEDWDSDIDDGVAGDAGTSTTKTFDLSEAGAGEMEGLFFRIESLPPAV